MLTLVPEEIEAYATANSTPLPPLLQELIETTQREMGVRSMMLSGQLEGTFLQTLVAVSGAERVLEIGTFTGFSGLMMAGGLPPGGKLITCEIDPKHAEMARAFFERSPDGAKIELREGPALETIATLDGPFDLVFIDADKESYVAYYEAVLPLLSPNGVIAVDNVLWSGRVLDPQNDQDRAIVAFNEHVQRDERVVNVLLTVRDGITLVRQRAG